VAKKKFDDAVKDYTPAELKKHKEAVKKYFLEKEGNVSVKVLSRVGQVPQKYIRDWMREEGWEALLKEDPEDKVNLSSKTKEVLEKGAKAFGLTEQEELFVYNYLKCFNATSAAMKAGHSSLNSYREAEKMMAKPQVKAFLSYIKQQRNQELFLEAVDIMKEYMRIAFADITDFVEFSGYSVKLKPSNKVDGHVIQEVAEGKEGVKIKLHDKMEALKRLERFYFVLPDDERIAIEKEKLKLMREKLDFDKKSGSDPQDVKIKIRLVDGDDE
jgi:phage terminase small subunit